MSKPLPGQTFTDPALAGRKDAFHSPCVLVVCAKAIRPGTSIRFIDSRRVTQCVASERQGIVDPFLRDSVNPDALFWVFICPELIGDLSHSFQIVGVPTEDTPLMTGVPAGKQLIDAKYKYAEHSDLYATEDSCDFRDC